MRVSEVEISCGSSMNTYLLLLHASPEGQQDDTQNPRELPWHLNSAFTWMEYGPPPPRKKSACI
jgi:hypothetical protein